MNENFKRWIIEAVNKRNDDVFTSRQIMDSILFKHGNSVSICSVSSIGWYISRMPNIEKVKEGHYRRKLI